MTDAQYSSKVFNAWTFELIGYGEAAENLVPVWEYGSENARRAAAYNAYPNITRELFDRLGT